MAAALAMMESSFEGSRTNPDERDIVETAEADPARFETVDNEALSSLLMLANSNPHLPAPSPDKEDSEEPTESSPTNDDAIPPQNVGHEPSPNSIVRLSAQPLTTNVSTEKPLTLPVSRPRVSDRPYYQPESASKAITIDDLRKYFHLPIAEVAKKLKTCTTALKKTCRKLNIEKWPYRQILSLTKSIQSLEMASLNDNLDEKLRQQYKEQISLLQKVIGEVIRDPNKTIEHCNLDELANAVVTGVAINAAIYGNRDDSGVANAGSDEGGKDSGNDIEDNAGRGIRNASEHPLIIPTPDEEVERTIRKASEVIVAPNRMISSSRKPMGSGVTGRFIGNGKRRSASLDDSDAEQDDEDYLHDSSNMQPLQPHQQHQQQPQSAIAYQQLLLQQRQSAMVSDGLVSSYLVSPLNSTAPVRYPNIEMGITSVKVHYFGDKKDQWQFIGPVTLAPLHRKKFKHHHSHHQSRRVVPLMEPDIGSNAAIEFVPQALINAFKKSVSEHGVVALASNVMLYDNSVLQLAQAGSTTGINSGGLPMHQQHPQQQHLHHMQQHAQQSQDVEQQMQHHHSQLYHSHHDMSQQLSHPSSGTPDDNDSDMDLQEYVSAYAEDAVNQLESGSGGSLPDDMDSIDASISALSGPVDGHDDMLGINGGIDHSHYHGILQTLQSKGKSVINGGDGGQPKRRRRRRRLLDENVVEEMQMMAQGGRSDEDDDDLADKNGSALTEKQQTAILRAAAAVSVNGSNSHHIHSHLRIDQSADDDEDFSLEDLQ